jgi:hypothetical protein
MIEELNEKTKKGEMLLLCFKFIDLMTIINQIEKKRSINIYFAPHSLTYYKLIKYNICLLYQRWIKTTKRNSIWDWEREGQKEKN